MLKETIKLVVLLKDTGTCTFKRGKIMLPTFVKTDALKYQPNNKVLDNSIICNSSESKEWNAEF